MACSSSPSACSRRIIFEAQVDLPRLEAERAPVRDDCATGVPGLFVERAQESEPCVVAWMFGFESTDERWERLVGAVHFGDRLVDFAPHRRSRASHGERVFERGEGVRVLVRLGLGATEVLERWSQSTIVTPHGLHDFLEFRLRALVLPTGVELASKLASHEDASRLLLHELRVKPLRALPVFRVERES